MLNINKQKWIKTDNETEYTYFLGCKFERPINSKTIPLSCPCCNIMLNNVDDIESVKNNDICEQCYLIHYYSNKEKWEKGWRPYK